MPETGPLIPISHAAHVGCALPWSTWQPPIVNSAAKRRKSQQIPRNLRTFETGSLENFNSSRRLGYCLS